MNESTKPWGKLIFYGIGSTACYAALFLNEQQVMQHFTRTDGAFWLLPVITAFIISYFHGGFTGNFWEVLGVQARKPVPTAVAKEELEE